MKKNELSISQRIIAVIIYIVTFILASHFLSGNWLFLSDSESSYNFLFISSALLLIFGSYIAEPYFTKPVDVLINSTAIILALYSIKDPSSFTGYWVLLYLSIALGIFSIMLILSSQLFKDNKLQQLFFIIITKTGQSKLVFSLMYFLTIYSYFKNQPIEFVVFITFWIVFISQYIIENLILFITRILKFLCAKAAKKQIIGEALGCENPFLYSIENDFSKHVRSNVKKGDLVCLELERNVGAVGIIINIKQLLNKRWLSIYLLTQDNSYLRINLKTNEFFSSSKTIYSKNNLVYLLDINEISDPTKRILIEENYFYKNRYDFIGYVTVGSDISKIKFLSLLDASNEKYSRLREGSIIKTEIYNTAVLYQIIDGTTDERELEKHNKYGYLTGIAHKLGFYDTDNKELKIVKWLPNIYAPIFFEEIKEIEKDELSIGCLPETNLEIIIKDADSLVTHNTAVLGILGIGKSCLTLELIQKTLKCIPNIKIICIDITNQYVLEINNYIKENLIQEELSNEALDRLVKENKTGTYNGKPQDWGNEQLYINTLNAEFQAFYDNAEKSVLIINPDIHSVSIAGSNFNITHKVDLTIAEKTRLISEALLALAKTKWDTYDLDEKRDNKAKFLLVFEEAHSLIPEFNSSANKGDQSASNGTAKVILQGRKFGLGSIIVTQRTANISKSILNQCNTIFALRVFDDTGKEFLANYIGQDYSNTLSTLDERHAIVVGKALKLKQPLIVKVNDRENVILKPEPIA